jgi:S1-C subfamily serine protease
LTVLALSACDPTEMYRRISEDNRVDIQVSDIKLLLHDGTELPAQIVLRDKDLDLAFIRPKTKPAKPMPAVDFSKSGTAEVLDPVITLNRLNRAANRAYAASSERISAIIQRPRTFYIPDSSMSTTTLGSPAFLMNGNILGIFVMRAVRTAGGSYNMRENMTSIILPAEDVLKAAKQAPEHADQEEKQPEQPEPAAQSSE